MSGSNKRGPWSVAIHADIFVLADGVKIAKRGDAARTGWTVRDGPDGLEVEYQGSARGTVHWPQSLISGVARSSN
jgi:hypothetical protein